MTLAHLDLSRGYRTCGVLVRQMSGYPTNQLSEIPYGSTTIMWFIDKALDPVSTTAFCYGLRERIQRRSKKAVRSVAKSSGIYWNHESPLFGFRCVALPFPQ